MLYKPLIGSLCLLATVMCSSAHAQNGSGSVTMYECGSVAVDYPANTTQSGSISLQGSAGQSFLCTDTMASSQQQVSLGFWETGVKYVYHVSVSLDGFVGDGTQIPLDTHLWNTFGGLSDTVIVQADTAGMATVRSWANPTYVNVASVKGDRWLRSGGALVPMANPFTDYPSISLLLLPGDVTNDNTTDRFDYNAFKNAFGSLPGDPNWNPLADLDGDGQIGRTDYNLFKTNFGKVGDN